MLNALLNALPAIFGALLLLAIAYFVARLVGGFVAGLLRNIGFDRFFARIGLFRGVAGVEPPPVNPYGTTPPGGGQPVGAQMGGLTPSAIVGYLVTAAIILFAAMEAANLLGFEILAVLVSRFIVAAT
jgi:small-conductance mechanosensitive channel